MWKGGSTRLRFALASSTRGPSLSPWMGKSSSTPCPRKQKRSWKSIFQSSFDYSGMMMGPLNTSYRYRLDPESNWCLWLTSRTTVIFPNFLFFFFFFSWLWKYIIYNSGRKLILFCSSGESKLNLICNLCIWKGQLGHGCVFHRIITDMEVCVPPAGLLVRLGQLAVVFLFCFVLVFLVFRISQFNCVFVPPTLLEARVPPSVSLCSADSVYENAVLVVTHLWSFYGAYHQYFDLKDILLMLWIADWTKLLWSVWM